MKAEREIKEYLLQEKGRTEVVAEMMLEKIQRYDDILQEFLYWLHYRNYQSESTVSVAGYDARRIYEIAPVLDGIGVYNLLVDLRDDPEAVQAAIDQGFVSK